VQILTNGAEKLTWTKAAKSKIMATEMKLLRSTGQKTIVDKTRNENIKKNLNTSASENKE
jgi:hypothetical protein